MNFKHLELPPLTMSAALTAPPALAQSSITLHGIIDAAVHFANTGSHTVGRQDSSSVARPPQFLPRPPAFRPGASMPASPKFAIAARLRSRSAMPLDPAYRSPPARTSRAASPASFTCFSRLHWPTHA